MVTCDDAPPAPRLFLGATQGKLMRIAIALALCVVLAGHPRDAETSEEIAPVAVAPPAPAVAKPASDRTWPGSDRSIESIADSVSVVIEAITKNDAAVTKRDESHVGTSMTVGGHVIRGGGSVTFVRCRQTFAAKKVLYGKFVVGDHLLHYGFVEKSDAFPGPRAQTAIPSGTEVLLFLDAQARILKALGATPADREAVEEAIPRLGKKPKADRQESED